MTDEPSQLRSFIERHRARVADVQVRTFAGEKLIGLAITLRGSGDRKVWKNSSLAAALADAQVWLAQAVQPLNTEEGDPR